MMQAMFFCAECGAANANEAQRCFVCDEPLSTSSPDTPVSFTQVSLGNGVQVFALAEPAETSYPTGTLPPGFLLHKRYQIIKQVGQGGFGVVYQAQDKKKHNKLVAVKQIYLDQLSARDKIQATDSYYREKTIHAPLRHKHVPRVYDHFTDPHNWYLVMDFIEGETLEEYLKHVPGGKLPPKEALAIGMKLSKVLHYLHDKHHVIFRDVKPANIMRTPRGRLYLIDFGIARRYKRSQSRDTMPLGSPGYAAPEQYGTMQTSAKTDIYGLGATLLTLLTGVDASEDTPSPSNQAPAMPERLQTLLDQMLAQDASQRPKDMYTVRMKLRFIHDGIIKHIALLILAFLIGMFLVVFPLVFLIGMAFLLDTLHMFLSSGFYGIFVVLLGIVSLLISLVIGIAFTTIPGKRTVGIGMLATILLLVLLIFYAVILLNH